MSLGSFGANVLSKRMPPHECPCDPTTDERKEEDSNRYEEEAQDASAPLNSPSHSMSARRTSPWFLLLEASATCTSLKRW